MKTHLLFLLLFASTGWLFAQPNYAPPSGVWCSCPPTTGNGVGSVLPDVAAKNYVQGILVRAVWKDVEPADNTYNWSLIDDQISAAQSYGKKISISIGGGPNSPDWLYAAGSESMSFSFPFAGTIPVPWDSIFLNKWTEFIAEFGNRYQNDTTIQLVYITNSSGNGFEMQIPFQPTPTYAELEYTDQKMIDSWKQVMRSFDMAFPNHYLTNDYHPVNSSDVVADSIYAFAQAQIGNRYGASAWWWTQHNTTVYPAQYSIFQHSAIHNSFTGLQMAASGVENPSTFGTGGMPAALNLAISDQVCYWEVWNKDILDGSFDTILAEATCNPVSATIAPHKSTHHKVNVFPNPTDGILYLEPMNNYTYMRVSVLNVMGQTILTSRNKQTIDISDWQAGTYLLKIEIDNTFLHQVVIKK